jgi:hypothetical protein
MSTTRVSPETASSLTTGAIAAEAATAVRDRTAVATPRDKIFFILFSSINFVVI